MSTKEQLSIIIHLVQVVKRCSKFNNVSRDRTALGMGEFVKATLSKFRPSVKSKLIMQTYDGASVMSGQLSDVRIRYEYPSAFFSVVLPITSNLFCASLPKTLSKLIGFFLLILFVLFPYLVLIEKHFLL